jgi:hypothetical protein
MNEAHFNEIERALLHVSDAARRVERTAADLERAGAEPHLVAALEQAKAELDATYRSLTQGTYFAVTDQERLAV